MMMTIAHSHPPTLIKPLGLCGHPLCAASPVPAHSPSATAQVCAQGRGALRYRHDPYSRTCGAVIVAAPAARAPSCWEWAAPTGTCHARVASAASSAFLPSVGPMSVAAWAAEEAEGSSSVVPTRSTPHSPARSCSSAGTAASTACVVAAAAAGGSALPSLDEDAEILRDVEAQHLLAMPYVPCGAVRSATRTSESRAPGTRRGDGVVSWARDDLARELNGPVAAAGADAPPATRTRMASVFVAQLPFDMQLEALQELADEVVPGPPVRIVFAAPHLRDRKTYDGCAFLRMPEADAQRFVAAVHKRVLFDVDGVWYAATAAHEAALQGYCAWVQDKPADERRRLMPRPTPFAAMTAEFALKSGSRLMRSRNMRL